MLKVYTIASVLLILSSCHNDPSKKIDKNQITDVYAYNLSYLRENSRKSSEEIYRNFIAWSWGKNPFGGGVILISIGKKDTVFYLKIKECYSSSNKTSILYGDCTEVYKEIDSTRYYQFSKEIINIDTKSEQGERRSSDPHQFYFEGLPRDTSILHGTSNDKFALVLAIKFLQLADYDKRAIQEFEDMIKSNEGKDKRKK